MKKIVTSLLFSLPFLAQAQPPGGISQGDMQAMMAKMQEVQSCMAQIDQNQINALQQQGQRMQSEVKALCADGKRDEAQRKAISYGMEIAQSPELQQMRECTKGMQAMMAQLPLPKMPYESLSRDSPDHVCDM